MKNDLKIIVNIKKILVIGFCSLILIGCSSNEPNPNISYQDKGLRLSEDDPIAFAYIKKDETLLDVSKEYKKPDEDIEVIRITKNGFHPNYTFTNETKPIHCGNADQFANNKRFCESIFSKFSTGENTTGMLMYTVLTAGVGALIPVISQPHVFNKESFFKVIEKNKLNAYRDKHLSDKVYASQDYKEYKQYRENYNPYRDNINKSKDGKTAAQIQREIQDRKLEEEYKKNNLY